MDNYQEILKTLAVEMDTTVEYLWSVLVKQAPITGVTYSVMCILGIVLILSLFMCIKKLIKDEHKKYGEHDNRGADNSISIVITIVTILLSVIIIPYILCVVPEIITCFINPEYWALKQILP